MIPHHAAYALRRILWSIPTLFGISLVVFFLTSLLPDPGGTLAARATALAADPGAYDALVEQRRQRFLDLPRFFNPRPRDVRVKAEEAVRHLVAEDAEAPFAARELPRLGGAALPYVLPHMDDLAPAERARVAVALAPVAERMGLGDPAELRDPQRAPVFWERFWEDRSLDFTEPSVRRSVTRMARHATDLREKDLQQVDTYAVPEVIREMAETQDRAALARLSAVVRRATGRGMVIDEQADARAAAHALRDWSEWWYVHQTDYEALDGPERVTATVSETRYGKWIARAALGEFGVSPRDGEPILAKIGRHAPITFALTGLSMLLSYLIAIPVAVVSAWRRGKPVDTVLGLVLLALYSMPTFWLAQLFARLVPHDSVEGRLVLPVIALTLASLAILSRYQRTAMLEVLGQDYVRTAHAKGVPLAGVIVVHALRNAMMPTVTLAGLHVPTLIGGAFVVEEVFALPGLGYESLRAVEGRDAAWLVATVLVTAVVAMAGIIASDVAYGLLDPRVRDRLGRHGPEEVHA